MTHTASPVLPGGPGCLGRRSSPQAWETEFSWWGGFSAGCRAGKAGITQMGACCPLSSSLHHRRPRSLFPSLCPSCKMPMHQPPPFRDGWIYKGPSSPGTGGCLRKVCGMTRTTSLSLNFIICAKWGLNPSSVSKPDYALDK